MLKPLGFGLALVLACSAGRRRHRFGSGARRRVSGNTHERLEPAEDSGDVEG